MVIHILLTVLDLVAAFILVSYTTVGWFSQEMVIYIALYMIIKGAIFAVNDFASRIDILVGIYMVLISLTIFSNTVLTIIAAIWLAQKMIFIIFGSIAKIFF